MFYLTAVLRDACSLLLLLFFLALEGLGGSLRGCVFFEVLFFGFLGCDVHV